MNDIKINGIWIGFGNVMKRLNFVEDIGCFTRKFTRIYVENNELFIGHTINKNKKIKFEYEHLNEWINYFDRI